ncbi:hypothetical protein ALT1545_20217 [Alteromonas macleodii]
MLYPVENGKGNHHKEQDQFRPQLCHNSPLSLDQARFADRFPKRFY